MSTGPTNARGEPITGWSPAPAVTHAQIVDLLAGLAADDWTDLDTWRYRDRYLTGSERLIVLGATEEHWADARTLRELDLDDLRAELRFRVFWRDHYHPERRPEDGAA